MKLRRRTGKLKESVGVGNDVGERKETEDKRQEEASMMVCLRD